MSKSFKKMCLCAGERQLGSTVISSPLVAWDYWVPNHAGWPIEGFWLLLPQGSDGITIASFTPMQQMTLTKSIFMTSESSWINGEIL